MVSLSVLGQLIWTESPAVFHSAPLHSRQGGGDFGGVSTQTFCIAVRNLEVQSTG